MAGPWVHRLMLPLNFPAGVRPGAGKGGGNLLLLARDGAKRPILRGTALCGALRHAFARSRRAASGAESVSAWFGAPLDGRRDSGTGATSPLRIADLVLGESENSGQVRHHISVDRHTGAVRDGTLFDLEALPPNTQGVALLELWEAPGEDGVSFLREIVGLFAAGVLLGGNAARGIGRAVLNGPALHRSFDLSKLEEHAAFLDERHRIRRGVQPKDGKPIEPARVAGATTLRIECEWTIPRGQDLLVADGQGLDYEKEPQRVDGADGKSYWRLPGSSLRGVLRAWISRLARRAGKRVDDSVECYQAEGGPAAGHDLAWGRGVNPQERKERRQALRNERVRVVTIVNCPIMDLFGSSYSRGRIHVSDGLAAAETGHVQARAHVAVDRVTGGANEGFFFENTVLTPTPRLRFPVTILIEDPTEEEARWLAKAIRAVDRGLIRVGSSKSSGRLALVAPPKAVGPHHECFSTVTPSEV